MNRFYSFLLVFLQFLIIIILLMVNKSIFTNFISLLVSSLGLIFGLYAISYNKLSNFNIIPEIKEKAELIKTGPYKYIRHPMYFAVFLIMLGVVLTKITYINISLYLCLVLVLFLKAKKEENLWIKKSKDYQEYKNNTKMFLPFIL